MPGPLLRTLTAPDGTIFRDLDHDGVMAPFEDRRLSPQERASDLVGRLSDDEVVGLLFHTMTAMGEGGTIRDDGTAGADGTTGMVTSRLINHLNVHGLGSARDAARWANALQQLAAQTPHSIPVTVSTDPRHGSTQNDGAAFASGAMSAWPEPLGFGALGDVDRVRQFADIARREYRAIGIHAALHPQIDLGTEPRWGRQYHTYGSSSELTGDIVEAYLDGFQVGADLGPQSVACMTKHFPGGGPQLDGEDPHFPYGREQVYPGDNFEYHLAPFRRAIARGTSALMPYYGMPIGLTRGGESIEEVGFGFNRQILTGLLREELGFDGVICTDWGLVSDSFVGPQVLPARAWGVEQLSRRDRVAKALHAGVDQFGGEHCTDLVHELLAVGAVDRARLDESARRLLTVKFQLGLFDDPFVDEDAAEQVVGHAEFREVGHRTQAESVVVLKNEGLLPLTGRTRLFVEGALRADDLAGLGEIVPDPSSADVIVVRLDAPFDPRSDLFLEAFFHQGTLDYRPGLLGRLAWLRALGTPMVVIASLDRPAILAPVVELSDALLVDFGSSTAALAAVLSGEIAPRARLPFEIPRSTQAVLAAQSDVADDTVDPLFPRGFGLDLAADPDTTAAGDASSSQ